MSRRWRSESIRSRICAWMVTSSAVVGSSAISSFGSHARAMAIITRWRSPPESWCGYCWSRSSGRGMPTRLSTSTALSSASFLVAPLWILTGSAIWRPMVQVGLSEVIGSWKIIAISLPRTRRICRSSRPTRSRPLSRTAPPGCGRPWGAASSRTGRSSSCRNPTRPPGPGTRPCGPRTRRRRRHGTWTVAQMELGPQAVHFQHRCRGPGRTHGARALAVRLVRHLLRVLNNGCLVPPWRRSLRPVPGPTPV